MPPLSLLRESSRACASRDIDQMANISAARSACGRITKGGAVGGWERYPGELSVRLIRGGPWVGGGGGGLNKSALLQNSRNSNDLLHMNAQVASASLGARRRRPPRLIRKAAKDESEPRIGRLAERSTCTFSSTGSSSCIPPPHNCTHQSLPVQCELQIRWIIHPPSPPFCHPTLSQLS